MIGSNVENCECEFITKRYDTFNPLFDDFVGSILYVYDDIILNKMLISDAADILCRGWHMKRNIMVLCQYLFFNCTFFFSYITEHNTYSFISNALLEKNIMLWKNFSD